MVKKKDSQPAASAESPDQTEPSQNKSKKSKASKSKKSSKLESLKQAIDDEAEEETQEVENTDSEQKKIGTRKQRGKKAVTTKKVTEQLEDLDVGDTEQRFDYDSEEEKEKENDIGEGSETQQDKGPQMSRKEKKKAAKQAKYLAESAEMEGSQFSLSQQEQTAKGALLENATDVKIEKFSIAARGKDLFVNAALTISQGRRYGLVGPNGMGKTTLLVHIARRQLAIPPNIDVLLCEQDIQVDETPAVEMVLKADKKRISLLQEEKHLLKAIDSKDEKESDAANKRLKEVCGIFCLFACLLVCLVLFLFFLCIMHIEQNHSN